MTAADDMTRNLKHKWFEAVVRQDMAYFDLKDVSGTSTIISTNCAKFKRGVATKLGAGVQFSFTVMVRTWSMFRDGMNRCAHLPSKKMLGWFCIGILQFLESKFGRLGMCPSHGNGHEMDVENQSNQVSS